MSSILGLVAEDTSGATGATGSSRTSSKTAATTRPCPAESRTHLISQQWWLQQSLENADAAQRS